MAHTQSQPIRQPTHTPLHVTYTLSLMCHTLPVPPGVTRTHLPNIPLQGSQTWSQAPLISPYLLHTHAHTLFPVISMIPNVWALQDSQAHMNTHTPVPATHSLTELYTPTYSSMSPNTPTQLVPTHNPAHGPHMPPSGTTLAQDIPREEGWETPGPQASSAPSPPPARTRQPGTPLPRKGHITHPSRTQRHRLGGTHAPPSFACPQGHLPPPPPQPLSRRQSSQPRASARGGRGPAPSPTPVSVPQSREGRPSPPQSPCTCPWGG